VRAAAVLTIAATLTAWAAPLESAPSARRRPPAHRSEPRLLDVQVRLDRAGFSPGEIDGRGGRNTTLALRAFQRARGLRETGQADRATRAALDEGEPADVLVEYTLAPEDVEGPWTPIPPDLEAQATLSALDFASSGERLGERFHASPSLLETLNAGVTFDAAGTVVRVPNVAASIAPSDPASVGGPHPGGDVTVLVSKHAGTLTVTAGTRVVFHAPVTTGSEHDPLPIGAWEVTVVTPHPVFFYNPELFWDADPSHAKLKLPPGPNNPVGVVWIGLSREHYGLHGTPEPKDVGHMASHGCVRLTNWDAARVAALVKRGTPVRFEE
jgi:lipoprotein-anchoring transpeptidase ErfK/SrfK